MLLIWCFMVGALLASWLILLLDTNSSPELRLRAWHHGYLGIGLWFLGLLFGFGWLAILGLVVLADDTLQHTVHFITRSDSFRSPLKRLSDLLWEITFFAALGRTLDRWFGR